MQRVTVRARATWRFRPAPRLVTHEETSDQGAVGQAALGEPDRIAKEDHRGTRVAHKTQGATADLRIETAAGAALRVHGRTRRPGRVSATCSGGRARSADEARPQGATASGVGAEEHQARAQPSGHG